MVDLAGLGQPFYKSALTGWTQLTYSYLQLSTTVKAQHFCCEQPLGRWVSLIQLLPFVTHGLYHLVSIFRCFKQKEIGSKSCSYEWISMVRLISKENCFQSAFLYLSIRYHSFKVDQNGVLNRNSSFSQTY